MSGPSSGAAQPLVVRDLGRRDYQPVWQAMQAFTMGRGPDTADELWLLEHNPVFTLGQGGRREHLLDPGDIPVLQVDRGGQVTYHGPGQLVAYLLLDLRRAALGVKALVACLEEAVIEFLAQQGLSAERSPGAPGVYLAGAKIASLGLRVRQGCCYHGLALNLDLDLEPFNRINPCGYAGLRVTRLADWVSDLDPVAVRRGLVGILARTLALTPLELGVEADGRP